MHSSSFRNAWTRVGKFGGLQKIDNNGTIQEAIKLVYRDNDILYVSIHSLQDQQIQREGWDGACFKQIRQSAVAEPQEKNQGTRQADCL